MNTAVKPEDDTPRAEPGDEHATQLVAFEIDDETYGVDITSVREIRAWNGVTTLPNTAPFVRGVMNLRGQIFPIIDLRVRFGRETTNAGENHVVVIVTIGEKWVGLLVDAVSDIVTLDRDQIRPVPDADSDPANALLSGIAAFDDRMIALIDPSRLVHGAVVSGEAAA